MKKLLLSVALLSSLVAGPAFAGCQVDVHVKADSNNQQNKEFRWTPTIIKFLGAAGTAVVSTSMLMWILKDAAGHDRKFLTLLAPTLVPAVLISAALATKYSAAIFHEIERRIATRNDK